MKRALIGIREVQRALKLSGPTLATYHLEKLEVAGLLKQTPEGYVVDKLVLENLDSDSFSSQNISCIS